MKLITLGKKLIVLLLVLSIITTPMLAQEATQSDYLQGKADGERDAKGNLLWVAAGCLPPYGNIAAYLIKPSPPAPALIGKSQQYILGYTEGYKHKSAMKNLKYSCIGSGILIGVVVVAVATRDWSCSPDFGCDEGCDKSLDNSCGGNDSSCGSGGDSSCGSSGSSGCSKIMPVKLF